MAEFQEVMRQSKRMCKSYTECGDCGLYVFQSCFYYPYDKLEMAERIIMEWAAEHPEPRYPTWKEWHDQNFPNADEEIFPCMFMACPIEEEVCDCNACRNLLIPADIAQKLGIKPITEGSVNK